VELPDPGARVVFNYHGSADDGAGGRDDSLYHAFRDSIGQDRSPAARTDHLLEIVGGVREGRMRFTWYYSENVHHRDTVERLAQEFGQALRSVARHLAGR